MTSPALESSGKPRSSHTTKARILEAAQICFATHGYVQGSVREIGRLANISPSLIMRYFGSKEALFEQAFRQSLDPGPMRSAPDEHVGDTVMALLSTDNVETTRTASMLALSVGDPQARAIATRLVEDAILGPLTRWFEGPHARARAELQAALTIGYTMLRLLVPTDHDSEQETAIAARWMSATLQKLVDPDVLRDDPAKASRPIRDG